MEFHSGRCLALRGEKHITATMQSLPAITHSYTIQPVISASGKLLSPMLIVLKELHGTFGPRIQQTMFRPQNLYICASSSGKVTKQIIKTWFQSVFLPQVNEQTVLLVDSWTGYDRADLATIMPLDRQCNIMTIPTHTTGLIQPLDVYGVRVWKNFVRKVSDAVRLQQLNINLHSRDNILTLQSLVHNQLSSPRYIRVF